MQPEKIRNTENNPRLGWTVVSVLRSAFYQGLAVLLSASLFNVAQADQVNIVRVGQCDWQCADTNFQRLSCHQRQDTAFEACANRALADGGEYMVLGGQYKVTAETDSTPTDPPISGSATLTWDAPTQNDDGSPLTDLAGFRLYYGDLPGIYATVIEIDDPTVTTYTVNDLTPGEWHFAATAINEAGRESEQSAPTSKTIQ